MRDFQSEKQIVRAFHAEITNLGTDPQRVFEAYCATDLDWRGFAPFGQGVGFEGPAFEFWDGLRQALTPLQHREDVFFSGLNEIDGFNTPWVVSMGHLMGLFDQPWLGIQPTNKMAFLRYATFHCVVDGKIVATAMYFDIPHLMMQAGLHPFPEQTGAHLVQPGPQTHNGCLFAQQPPEEGEATLALINRMISDLGQWDNDLTIEDELRQTWAEDMIWWGPAGIGATFTIPRYIEQHAGPFRSTFAERSGTGHIARLAEGAYGGFFGWPNFTAVPVRGYMGLPTQKTVAEFRVIDIYRRSGDKLAENWIFIDLVHFWRQQGIDILAASPVKVVHA